MKFISSFLGNIGKAIVAGLATFAGLFVALALLVTLFTGGNLQKGLSASLNMTRYTVIFLGGCLSYADNLIPDLQSGKALGDKALSGKPKI